MRFVQIFVDNTRNGLDKLIHNLKRLEIEVSNVEFCLEATGHYWLSLYYHLTELVINPIQSDALRNFYVRKTKTDRKDAHLLADIVRFGKLFLSCKTYHFRICPASGWAKKQGSRYHLS